MMRASGFVVARLLAAIRSPLTTPDARYPAAADAVAVLKKARRFISVALRSVSQGPPGQMVPPLQSLFPGARTGLDPDSIPHLKRLISGSG